MSYKIINSLIETKRILEKYGFENLELIPGKHSVNFESPRFGHRWGIKDEKWGEETYVLLLCEDENGKRWYEVEGDFYSTEGDHTPTYYLLRP